MIYLAGLAASAAIFQKQRMLWRCWNSEVKRRDKIRGVRRSHGSCNRRVDLIEGLARPDPCTRSRLAKIAKTASNFLSASIAPMKE